MRLTNGRMRLIFNHLSGGHHSCKHLTSEPIDIILIAQLRESLVEIYGRCLVSSLSIWKPDFKHTWKGVCTFLAVKQHCGVSAWLRGRVLYLPLLVGYEQRRFILLGSLLAVVRDWNNGVGINVVHKFDEATVKIGLVGVFGDHELGDLVEEDDGSYAFGGNLGFGGFTVGASYGDNGDTGRPTGDGSDAGDYFEIAGGYKTGDFAFHVGYFNGEAANVTGTTDDETRIFTLGANYNMAPGLRVYAEFDDIDVDQPGVGAGNDNDGQVFMIGTNISF